MATAVSGAGVVSRETMRLALESALVDARYASRQLLLGDTGRAQDALERLVDGLKAELQDLAHLDDPGRQQAEAEAGDGESALLRAFRALGL